MSISREEYATIVSSFLKEVDFELQPWEFRPGVRQEVIDHFDNKPWSKEQREYAVRVAKSLFSCIIFYPFAKREVQVTNGILSTYVTLMDDNQDYLGIALDNFTPNMLRGKPQEHPFLQSLMDFLSNDLKFMSPFVHSMVIQDVNNFVAGCLIERDYTSNIIPGDGSINFARYMREKSCIGEAYAYWAFADFHPDKEQRERYMAAVQDLRIFIGQANDILSLYKESIDGVEELTYMVNVAKAQNLSIPDALRLVCSDVAQNIKNIRTMLSRPDQEDLLKIANGVINGFLSWHMHLGRYRLDEVPLVDKDNKLMKLTMNEPKFNKRERQFVFGVPVA